MQSGSVLNEITFCCLFIGNGMLVSVFVKQFESSYVFVPACETVVVSCGKKTDLKRNCMNLIKNKAETIPFAIELKVGETCVLSRRSCSAVNRLWNSHSGFITQKPLFGAENVFRGDTVN